LKGSGWYVTDYASGSRSSASNNSSKESTDTSKDSGTSDSASKES